MVEYLQPLRRQLMQIPSLTDIRSQSESGVGIIRLSFDYGADIDFIFVEVNERIDRALSSLPEGAERPKALKSSATDIPAFFVNMTVRDTSRTMELSRLASSVISKRIEQIPEVAMVDLSGLVFPEILIIPDIERLTAIGVTPERLSEAIEANNIRLGNLSIRDGQYHWNIRFNSEINSKDDIENIRLNIGGRVYLFSDLAEVIEQPASEDCLIRSDGSRAVSMAIIKQSDARMNTLQDELNGRIEEFREDYPGVEFTVTRDQTELLRYTIENLEQNLYAGIILASIVILLFMRNFRFSLLIIPTIIVSLLTSMLALFLMGISINIISLAGLILSVGMMVDNSIIVIDNITQRWERGDNLEDAVAIGSGEVFAPMLSSILTNCAVFVPLVFLSGIAGEIFFDQAVAITVGLFSSLLFAVLVVPVYYYAMYRRRGRKVDNKYLARIDRFLELGPSYEKALKWTFRHQGTVLTLMAVSIPLSVLLFMELDKSTFPPVTKSDIILNVDWNRPVTIAENDRRSTALVESVQPHTAQVTQMCGTQQFLMPHTRDMSQSEAQIYFKARTAEGLDSLMNGAAAFLREHYPDASFNFTDAGNLFTLMFSSDGSKLTVQISGRDGRTPEPDRLNSILADIGEAAPDVYISPISWQEQIMLVLDIEKMSLYGISYSDVLSTLRKRTREDNIFSITTGDYSIPVVVGDRDRSPDLLNGSVRNRDGADIPLNKHPYIRTVQACYASSRLAVQLATEAGARLHVMHVSTAKELPLFSNAPLDGTKQITAEACVAHLLFEMKDYKMLAACIKCNPAVKRQADRDALRRAVVEGQIDLIATDHAPHLLTEKTGGALRAASGMPMVQFSLVSMLQLADEGIFTPELVVEKMCHAPARLFRIEGRGFIREGYRADLVLVRPHTHWQLTRDKILSKCGWSPLEGRTFEWQVEKTFANGHLVYDHTTGVDDTYRGEELRFHA